MAGALEVGGGDAAVRVADVGPLGARLPADGLQRLAQRPRDARQEAHHLRKEGCTRNNWNINNQGLELCKWCRPLQDILRFWVSETTPILETADRVVLDPTCALGLCAARDLCQHVRLALLARGIIQVRTSCCPVLDVRAPQCFSNSLNQPASASAA